MLKRRQLIELHDLSWFPEILRSLGTDYLQTVSEMFRPFGPKLPLLLDAVRASGSDQILDLCSGSGGPWRYLARDLAEVKGGPVAVVLSDKFPNPELSHHASGVEGVSYCSESVDATRVPPHLHGTRTMFNSFHHFAPEQARAILHAAVQDRQPIAVFEMLQRNWLDLLFMVLTPIFTFRLVFMKPLSFARLFWTFGLPLFPLYMFWDALVSVIRCYSPAELLVMAQDSPNAAEYVWEAGEYWHRGLPVTYLVGYPRSRPAETHSG